MPKEHTLHDVSTHGLVTFQEIGRHPESGKPVTAAVGAYGPYVRHKVLNASLPKV